MSGRHDDYDLPDLVSFYGLLHRSQGEPGLAGSWRGDHEEVIGIAQEASQGLFLPHPELGNLAALLEVAGRAECLPVDHICLAAARPRLYMVGVPARLQLGAASAAATISGQVKRDMFPAAEPPLFGHWTPVSPVADVAGLEARVASTGSITPSWLSASWYQGTLTITAAGLPWLVIRVGVPL